MNYFYQFFFFFEDGFIKYGESSTEALNATNQNSKK